MTRISNETLCSIIAASKAMYSTLPVSDFEEWSARSPHYITLACHNAAEMAAEIVALREALDEISDRHIPDQPAALGMDELSYVKRQYAELRKMARTARKGPSDD